MVKITEPKKMVVSKAIVKPSENIVKLKEPEDDLQLRPKEDSIVTTLKNLVTSYFSKIPFVRKKELAEIITNPDVAIPKELETTSIKTGFLDAIKGYLYYFGFYLVAFVLFYAALFLVMYLISPGTQTQLNALSTLPNITSNILILILIVLAIIIGCIVAIAIFGFIGLILSTSVFFISAKIFGGKGGFWKMFGMIGSITGAMILLQIPLIILSFIPCLGYLVSLVGIYQLYLIYKLNMKLHGLDSKNAIFSVILPVALLIILAIVVFVLYFAFLFSLGMFSAVS